MKGLCTPAQFAASHCKPSVCGDGSVDLGEECDLGTGNSDTGECTTTCKIPICGDGFTQISNNEACDLGSGTNGQTGRDCTANCLALDCNITCTPVVDPATQTFETNCSTNTSSPALASALLEYQGSNVGTSFNPSSGEGNCSTSGGTAHVRAVINYNGAEVCETTVDFSCNVCKTEVPNNLTTDDQQTASDAGKGCPRSWNCTATKGDPNDGWSSPDQLGNCYCLPDRCTTT